MSKSKLIAALMKERFGNADTLRRDESAESAKIKAARRWTLVNGK